MEHVRAPFTDEQVRALNDYQRSGRFHPFTCGREHPGGHRVLVATTSGWECPEPECDYTQDWAHEFMTRRSPFQGGL